MRNMWQVIGVALTVAAIPGAWFGGRYLSTFLGPVDTTAQNWLAGTCAFVAAMYVATVVASWRKRRDA